VAGLRGSPEAAALLFSGREFLADAARPGEGEPLHSDDRLQLEFRAPRGLMGGAAGGSATTADLAALHRVPPAETLPGDPAALERARAARGLARDGLAALRSIDEPVAGRQAIDEILRDPLVAGRIRKLLPPDLGEQADALLVPGAEIRRLPPALFKWTLRARALDLLGRAFAAGVRDPWAVRQLAALHRERGERHVSTGHLVPAEEDFRRAVEVQPRSPLARTGLAQVLLRRLTTKQDIALLDEAEVLLEEALLAHPRCEPARVERARARIFRGDLEGADRDLAAMLDLRPDSVAALSLLAALRRQQGRGEDALALAEACLRLHPRNRNIEALRNALQNSR